MWRCPRVNWIKTDHLTSRLVQCQGRNCYLLPGAPEKPIEENPRQFYVQMENSRSCPVKGSLTIFQNMSIFLLLQPQSTYFMTIFIKKPDSISYLKCYELFWLMKQKSLGFLWCIFLSLSEIFWRSFYQNILFFVIFFVVYFSKTLAKIYIKFFSNFNVKIEIFWKKFSRIWPLCCIPWIFNALDKIRILILPASNPFYNSQLKSRTNLQGFEGNFWT